MLITFKCRRFKCSRVGRFCPKYLSGDRVEARHALCRSCVEEFAAMLPPSFDCVVDDLRTGDTFVLVPDAPN